MLTVDHVRKTFGELTAVADISFKVQPGTTLALLGTSGCGKSTLLRIIAGLVDPDAGAVNWRDNPIDKNSLQQWRTELGYVIQEGGLFPHLTLKQNVTLMAHQLGWTDQRIAERIDELAMLTHLPADLLDRYPVQVSGGQRQRVALMRALFLDPAVLLLDEPLGALDPIIRADLQQELRSIFQTLKKTVVLVTHDLHEAGFLADQIIVMNAGRMVQRGTLIELIEQPADEFVAQFVNAQHGSASAQ